MNHAAADLLVGSRFRISPILFAFAISTSYIILAGPRSFHSFTVKAIRENIITPDCRTSVQFRVKNHFAKISVKNRAKIQISNLEPKF